MTGIGRDAVIQRQAAFEHPIKEGGAKSRITHRQPRFGKRGVEGKLGISAAFDAQKRLLPRLGGMISSVDLTLLSEWGMRFLPRGMQKRRRRISAAA